MKIGLLITSIGNFGQKGFYNAQEIGLAKELNKLVDEVVIYKLVSADQQFKSDKLEGCLSTTLHLIPCKSLGINGFFNTKYLDVDLDVLIYFSDTQLMVPTIDRWAKRQRVALFPYIGVLESHSTNKLVKKLIDFLFWRNVKVYKYRHCFVKTPDVQRKLHKLGVKHITVAPVGLDQTLLHESYAIESVVGLKKKYGFQNEHKILLFIGRFVEEKQPERMLDVFKAAYENDNTYRLVMVGTGILQQAVENRIKELNLSTAVTIFERIPNSDIWELYRLADHFVNLNQQEIFGMAILEAMYYECHVIAWKAPGPSYIIEDGVSGDLVSSNDEVIDLLSKQTNVTSAAHERIEKHFTWAGVSQLMVDTILRR